MVDTEKLISLVYERKQLWDVQRKHYQNRDVARKPWLEIAEEFKNTSKFLHSNTVFYISNYGC
jgi:hypothetical protein